MTHVECMCHNSYTRPYIFNSDLAILLNFADISFLMSLKKHNMYMFNT